MDAPARSGLLPALERRLMRRAGTKTGRRMKTAAVLRAVGVLLRRHPMVAAEMVGAGLAQAGRVGLADLRDHFRTADAAADPTPLTRAEVDQFRRLLARRSADAKVAQEPGREDATEA